MSRPSTLRIARQTLKRVSHCSRSYSQTLTCRSQDKTPNSAADPEFLPLPRALSPRRGLLLLSIPVPPTSWPSHIELESSLVATTTATLKSKGVGVNVVYNSSSGESKPTFDRYGESYPARLLWPDGKIKNYKTFNIDTLNSDELASELNYQPAPFDGSNPEAGYIGGTGKKEILVCTHGSRDCRCSDRGGPLIAALREEVERRNLSDKLSIGEIAHVGGHKYAANALLLPSLDMLSNLTVEHAPSLVSHVMGTHHPLPLWSHWRGRIGLNEEEQAQFWAKVDPSNGPLRPTMNALPQADAGAYPVKLRFKTFQGEDKVVDAKLGENLLDVGKAHDLPSLEGVCEGNLECATCHLYLYPSSSSGAPPVPEPTEEELDMLGYALGYRDQSRLGCQIKVTKDLGQWCELGGVICLPRF